jgi:hypothetical protein
MALHPISEEDLEPTLTRAAARPFSFTHTAWTGESAGTQISKLFQQYAPLGYMLPWETLDYVELLSTYNPDYSQAVDNVRTLANSGHELFVGASAPRTAARIKDRLEEKARTIQSQHGGIDGLIDKLLDQAAVYGAMCGEWVLNDALTDVVDFIDINPKSIRFFWSEPDQRYVPFQKVSIWQAQQAEKQGQEVKQRTYVRLNELTFHYYAFDAAPQSPYGCPPFLAALANIAIQRDMIYNMAQIVKKVGLLGIIDLVVKSLPVKAGETEADYQARASMYLDQYATVLEEAVRDGGLVHYDDTEIHNTNITGNAAGATNIFKQNEELIFSGLKSMPSVQGRSYSTTETYAGVAYDIIIRNTQKYQRACKRMIESGYWLMVTLWGEQPDNISLTFNDNKTLNRLQNAQAQKQEIQNAVALWLTGIIDQLGFAQLLGYNQPKTEMATPPKVPLLGTQSSGSSSGGGGSPDGGAPAGVPPPAPGTSN